MNDIPQLALALLAGLALGAFFFGGLWWTIKRGLLSPRAPLWFLGSFVIRIAVVLAGFYFVGQGRPERLIACLLGFIVARFAMMMLRRLRGETRQPEPGNDHAA